MKRTLILAALVAAAGLAPRAQMRVVPVDEEQGHVALGLALRHLGNAGVFMMATAHPDDENNGLLVQLNRGQGYRTALATATRGNGGQNEIGPEIFEALGVLRTEELLAAHRSDGAEQFITVFQKDQVPLLAKRPDTGKCLVVGRSLEVVVDFEHVVPGKGEICGLPGKLSLIKDNWFVTTHVMDGLPKALGSAAMFNLKTGA